MMVALAFGLALALAIVLAAIVQQRRRTVRVAAIDHYAFPRGVRERVARRYPHLSEQDLDLVFTGLRDYFHLCRMAGRRMLAMPSQVVDAAWHEFILFTRHYDAFCRHALGRFLHHTPAEAMPTPTTASAGIRRSWRLACRRAGIDPRAPTALPLLFAIDSRLAIPDGYRYALNCAGVNAAAVTYCASHIGCGGGCSSSVDDGGGSGGDGGSGCGGD
jgi:hypothetical protein